MNLQTTNVTLRTTLLTLKKTKRPKFNDVAERRTNAKSRVLVTTRPDTRPIPVADGWALQTEMHIFALSNSITSTDGPTDGPTDGQSLL